MRLLLTTPVVLLTGCAQLFGSLPSLQYCSEVSYERNGNQIKLEARCQAPIGGGLPGL